MLSGPQRTETVTFNELLSKEHSLAFRLRQTEKLKISTDPAFDPKPLHQDGMGKPGSAVQTGIVHRQNYSNVPWCMTIRRGG
jgi:hypothetical protein